MSKQTRHIVISEENYLALRTLGNVGDTFDDVITKILKKEIKNE